VRALGAKNKIEIGLTGDAVLEENSFPPLTSTFNLRGAKMKVRRQILLGLVMLIFLVPPVARSQESTAEVWKRMDYTQQILFVKGFHAGVGAFEGQKDSEFVNQLTAIGFFGEPKMDDWDPMIHKINGFYSQPKNDFIPLSMPVFLSIAFVKGIPQGKMQSILSKGGGPEVVKDFYESKSVVQISPGQATKDKISSIEPRGWLLMFNPSADDLKLPITEWVQISAHDTAVECQKLLYRMSSEAQKIEPGFKAERQRCVPSDTIYPHTTPKK